MADVNPPTPQTNQQISQPMGELTPELSWITGDTLNLILGSYFYIATLDLVHEVTNTMNQDSLLSGNSPFKVKQNTNPASDFLPAASVENVETDEDYAARLETFAGGPPETPDAPLPPPEITPDTAGREHQRDNYIFMIE